jgi:hypothetical protein
LLIARHLQKTNGADIYFGRQDIQLDRGTRNLETIPDEELHGN